MNPTEWLQAPVPTWLAIALALGVILNVYDAAKSRSCSCGAPANAQRHKSECPWGSSGPGPQSYPKSPRWGR